MQYLYHICGENIAVDTRWNGLTHYIVFLSDGGDNIDHCPQCREALFPEDVGVTILSGERMAALIDQETLSE